MSTPNGLAELQPTSAARSRPRSCGRSRTSRASRFRSRTTGSSTGSSPCPIRAASPTCGARRDLQVDGADPVEPARRRALGARGDRRGVPLAEDHDARARFNPMKRNRGGERDLDHIIVAAIRGLDRAEPRVPAGARRADPDDGPDVHRASRTRSSSRRRSATRHAESSGSTSPGPRPDGAARTRTATSFR